MIIKNSMVVFLLFALASCSQSKKDDIQSEIDRKSISVIEDFLTRSKMGRNK